MFGIVTGAMLPIRQWVPLPPWKDSRSQEFETIWRHPGNLNQHHPVDVIRTIDGDTFEARVHLAPGQNVMTRIRLRGIDAPELKAACPEELRMAEAASSALRDLLGQGEVAIYHIGPDKYQGRVVADVATRRTGNVSAALITGCDAVHPGYGFLSEDDAFADAVRAHDLTFIGPPSHVLERFASKEETRRLLAAHGLPTIPGSGLLLDEAQALEEAERIGYPVLIKPSAGGGGKGMRMVRSPRELAAVLPICRSEARAAFGDDSLYLERWLQDNRHVEVQVAVDRFGHGVHLWERDCSVQRRHQKILEESPSPAMSAAGRRELAERAIKAVVAAGYENVGTLEFLVDNDGNAYFIEINCRIQVEHPVTEMLTGIEIGRASWRERVL